MPGKQPSPSVRATLDALDYRWTGHQLPQKDGRKLERCAEPHDPWRVSVYRKDRQMWAEGAWIGYAEAATLDEAITAALGSTRAQRCAGGLLKVMADLGVELNVLTVVMATGDVPF